MRTRHVYENSSNLSEAIRNALREVKSYQSYLRIVNCGRGVVILPDTDRQHDCTEGELIKALSLVKKCDNLHSGGDAREKQVERTRMMFRRCDDTPDWVSLTPDQKRLLEWLRESGYLWDEVTIEDLAPDGFYEI